jgi:hypothetical protein
MKLLALILTITLLPACGSQYSGELRHKLFVECMELAAKLPSNANSISNAHTIKQCSTEAQFMANSYGAEETYDDS